MGVFYQEPSLLVGLSKPVANRRLVWRCELRLCLGLSFLFFDTLTLAHIRGLEPERTTAQKPILVSCPLNKHAFRCDQNGPPARREEVCLFRGQDTYAIFQCWRITAAISPFRVIAMGESRTFFAARWYASSPYLRGSNGRSPASTETKRLAACRIKIRMSERASQKVFIILIAARIALLATTFVLTLFATPLAAAPQCSLQQESQQVRT